MTVQTPAWLKAPTERTLYHRFYYRLRKGKNIQKDWSDLVAESDEGEQMRFVQSVVAKGKRVRQSHSRKEEKGEEASKEWCTFNEISTKDGYDLTIECLRAGTLEGKRNPLLPMDTQIQWPYTLIVRKVRVVEKEKTTHAKERAVDDNGTDDELGDSLEAEVSAAFASKSQPATQRASPETEVGSDGLTPGTAAQGGPENSHT